MEWQQNRLQLYTNQRTPFINTRRIEACKTAKVIPTQKWSPTSNGLLHRLYAVQDLLCYRVFQVFVSSASFTLAVFIPGHFSAKSTWIDEMMTDSHVKLVWTQFAELLNSCLFPAKTSTIASIFGVEINCNQSQQSTSSVYLFQNRSEYWTFPVEEVALWVNRKPNKEFDLQMTGSQEVSDSGTNAQ